MRIDKEEKRIMSNLSRPKDRKGKIVFMAIFLAAIFFVLVLGYVTQQKNQTQKALRQERLESKDLARQAEFLQAQAEIDSLLVIGKTEEALELYRKQLSRSDTLTRGFADLRLKVARELFEAQQKSAASEGYNTELRETREKLSELRDSLEQMATETSREKDSLARVITSSMYRLRKLKEELAEKAANNFLSFTNPKGNKVFYIGEVEDAKANGHGIGIWLTGSKYEGEWKDNQRHGKGVFEWADGEHYEGGYRNDMRHGQGTYHWTNGQKYVGEWARDKRNGQGTFYNEDGEVLAEGKWKDDELVEVAAGEN